jgi:phosphoribosylanthranilate isomerase
MNPPKVKICGMTDAENMREIAALRPDYFGLIFYPKSPRYVSPAKAADLPQFENIKRVGVFVNEAAENILQIAEQARLNLVQLHGGESPEFCESLRAKNIEIIKVFSIDENFDGSILKQYEAVCDYFLFDTKTPQHGGSGREFDWQILRRFEMKKPFFLSGGIGAENAVNAVAACESLPLHALDINSRAETRAGIKSFDLVKEIINDR